MSFCNEMREALWSTSQWHGLLVAAGSRAMNTCTIFIWRILQIRIFHSGRWLLRKEELRFPPITINALLHVIYKMSRRFSLYEETGLLILWDYFPFPFRVAQGCGSDREISQWDWTFCAPFYCGSYWKFIPLISPRLALSEVETCSRMW